ncbi:MAG: hypothetical protein SFY80_10875, partial [Verrucomicrobiota bacterium]|nr:hypothetical protein [Verrucomicrobiota bacterium]
MPLSPVCLPSTITEPEHGRDVHATLSRKWAFFPKHNDFVPPYPTVQIIFPLAMHPFAFNLRIVGIEVT